jgi:hypothetical protein
MTQMIGKLPVERPCCSDSEQSQVLGVGESPLWGGRWPWCRFWDSCWHMSSFSKRRWWGKGTGMDISSPYWDIARVPKGTATTSESDYIITDRAERYLRIWAKIGLKFLISHWHVKGVLIGLNERHVKRNSGWLNFEGMYYLHWVTFFHRRTCHIASYISLNFLPLFFPTSTSESWLVTPRPLSQTIHAHIRSELLDIQWRSHKRLSNRGW